MSVNIKRARMATQGSRGTYGQGGLLSFLGNAAKKVAGVAVSTLTGGPLAGVRSAAAAIAPRTTAAVMPAIGVAVPRFAGPSSGGGGGLPAGRVTNPLAAILPGGSTGRSGGCASGYHPNRTGYYTKSGGWVDPGTKCVRNRRRNALNPRALDRSMGRLASAGNALRSLGFRAPTAKGVAQKGKPRRRRKK